MPYLIGVSLLWAFSFGLIKGQLTGLDSTAVAVIRLGCAAIVFLPFFRPRLITRSQGFSFAAVGAIQFGLMYVLYLAAYRHLQAYEVAMFTIFTPIYVILLDGALEGKVERNAILAAALAVVGAGVLQWRSGISPTGIIGFGLMQGSNLCFAAGQIAYKRLRARVPKVSDASLFGWLYGGAILATTLASLITTEWGNFAPSTLQWRTMIFLGLVASGIGFFGWNVGATKVSASTLAVFNNLKIPLAVAVALLVFGETADRPRLLICGGFMVAAIYVAERRIKT
jgi:drug/metabolite transporter (DMT)-like permease